MPPIPPPTRAHRNHLPRRPLWSLAGSSTAALALTTSIYALVMHFGIDSWRQGLHMAAVLLVIDSALNAR